MKYDSPQGLGGWLILPIIGLFILPIKIIIVLTMIHLPIFLKGQWDILTNPNSEVYHALWGPILIGEITFNIFFFLFSVFLLIILFKKKTYFPKLIITYYILNTTIMIIFYYLSGLIPAVAETPDPESARELVRTIIGSAIWIPYFIVSKRVKHTFINP
jgi:hypothetical protein